MNTCDVTKLADRIGKEYAFTEKMAFDKALKILRECPDILIQNVQEWSEYQTLNDIYIDNYSIPMIMTIWKNKDFLRALDVMIILFNGDVEKAELKIWNMRR